MADQNPDLKQLYLDKIKEHKDRKLTDENEFLSASDECDSVLGELEDQLAKQWKGKLGMLIIYVCLKIKIESCQLTICLRKISTEN